MNKGFKDYFSNNSSLYARYRPVYPKKLFNYLADISSSKNLAWDCGTGNGQAARGLAEYFRKVIATDASAEQIFRAKSSPNIEYLISSAENSGIMNSSADLITVAQAFHWFDSQKFYEEARRVIKPEGIICLITYGLINISPEADEIVKELYFEIVGDYWPPERKLVDEAYRNIDFPFQEIILPVFEMKDEWNFEQFMGYLETWSAVQKFIYREGINPLLKIEAKLKKQWSWETKTVSWPLVVRAGKYLPPGSS